jgi:hypothetical protein
LSDRQPMIPGLEIPIDCRKPTNSPPAKSLRRLCWKVATLEKRVASVELEQSLFRIQMEHESEGKR